LPLITGIRHWSTPNYTRVAIDLQQEVRYQASRVPSPDRIFFDLYGTRLSPELVGRSVEVTDDGFLTHIRAAQFSGGVTRIVLDVHSLSDYSAFFLPNPPRLIIDVHGRKGGPPPLQLADRARSAIMRPARLLPPATVAHPENPSSSIHTGVFPAARVDSPLADVATLSDQPNQVRATRYPTTAPVMQSVAGTTPAPQPSYAQRTRSSFAKPSAAVPATDEVPPAKAGANGISAGQHVPTSMVRALGLKINRIVIDAGHGGHDSGTVSPGGVEEKDVVLDVALRLGRLLRQRLGADVIYTRTNDTFVPLETRTAIANQAQADLFISIHANSSPDTSARGVEVYYLNFTTSADALEVAARENAVSDESIHQLSDLVKKIALDDKISESRQFAADVDESLYAGLEPGNPGLKDRGVKKAPFVVLIGANMPSILAEISFLTNPEDAQELQESQYRQRIAEALYRGVARYVSSLNGVRLAQAASQPSGTE
jgi:N-acetylmuramoyl-L-alanine amidase